MSRRVEAQNTEKARVNTQGSRIPVPTTRRRKLSKAKDRLTSALPSTVTRRMENSEPRSRATQMKNDSNYSNGSLDQDLSTQCDEEVIQEVPGTNSVAELVECLPDELLVATSDIEEESPCSPVTDLKSTKSFSQHKCEEIERKLIELDNERIKLNEIIASLEARQNGPTKQTADAEMQVKELEADKKKLEKDVLEQRESSTSLLGNNQKLNEILLRTKTEHLALNKENQRLLRQLDDLLKEKEDADTKVYNISSAYNAREAKFVRQQNEIEELSKARNALQHRHDSLKKNYEKLELARHHLFVELEKHHSLLAEAQEAYANAKANEEVYKGAARKWKMMLGEVRQDKENLVGHCDDLVKENSALREERSIDDDSTLREKLASLKYWVRGWCDQVVESKSSDISAFFEDFPLDVQEPRKNLTKLFHQELNILTASIWEWLIKLVFGPGDNVYPEHRYPDLWTDEDTSLCLNVLEHHFQGKDQESAIRWRHRTVQQLGHAGLCQPAVRTEAKIEFVVDEIVQWTRKCFKLSAPSDESDSMKVSLRSQVIDRAIDLAMDLRRQNSVVTIQTPCNIGDVLRSNPALTRPQRLHKEDEMLSICVGPELKRLAVQAATSDLSASIIVEADFCSMHIQPWPPLEPQISEQDPQHESTEDNQTDILRGVAKYLGLGN